MAIELKNETPITLAQVGQYLPPGRHGKRVSLSCALRWVMDGVRLPTGEVVRLDGLRVGGKWITTVEAIERFAAAQTPRFSGSSVASPLASKMRTREAGRVELALEKARI